MNWANALTFARVLLVAPTASAIIGHHWWYAALWFTLAAASDLLDGPVARRRGQATPFGGFFDHATDALYVSVCLGALAWLGLITWLLVILVPAAFTQYTLDSRALSGAQLRTNLLGRSNGIAYFVLVGFAIGAQCLAEIAAIKPWLPNVGFLDLTTTTFAWVLVATTVVSMGERLWLLVGRGPRQRG